MGRDYYQILGVSRNADENELKKGERAAWGARPQLSGLAPSPSASRTQFSRHKGHGFANCLFDAHGRGERR